MLTYTQEPIAWTFLDNFDTWHTEINKDGVVDKSQVFVDPQRAFISTRGL